MTRRGAKVIERRAREVPVEAKVEARAGETARKGEGAGPAAGVELGAARPRGVAAGA